MSAHFSMSESSKGPQSKINSSFPNFSVKVELPDYSHFALAHPPFTRITDQHAPLIAPFIKVEVPREPGLPAPHTPEELMEIARLANGLLRKAAADKVPHVHYPFTNDKPKAAGFPATSSETHYRNRKDRKNRKNRKNNAPHRLFSPQRARTLAHLKIFTRSYHCPTTITPRAPGDHRPLIKFYSKSYFDAQTGHFKSPGPEPQPKPELKSRKLRLFYVKAFLTGVDAKTEVGDRRVFYQRRLVCREM
jgi:hypothetical protein